MSEEAIIIPRNEFDPGLEEKVRFYLELTPDLPRNDKRVYRTTMPDTRDEYERQVWELEEIRRIKEGHHGLSPKYYFFYNYCYLDTQDGLRRPDFKVCQHEFLKAIEKAQASQRDGLISVKRRRIGASSMLSSDVLHDCILNPFFRVGMNSKTERDSVELFKKVKLGYDHLPSFLKPASSAGNTRTSMVFGYRTKDQNGNWQLRGTQSRIDVVAPVPTAYEGQRLNKLVMDECFGKGTPVRMHNGDVKSIEDIKIGDIVMGLDAQPRTVYDLTSGYDDLYLITPNKGKPFVVNSQHLLTLKFNGVDSVIDYKTEDFSKLRYGKQRYYQMFRDGWDYLEQPLPFDPYWTGLWLGDGYSASATVITPDQEIKDFLENSHIIHNCSITIRDEGRSNLVSYHLHNNNKPRGVFTKLKEINLYKNKHIPEVYLRNSRANRLKLLAGIIDSDGHKDPRKNSYEVTFKVKRLAENLQELATSLGFYASFNPKIATMKRKDGSIYRCEVYRVGIFGNKLHEIPCRVKRKQITKIAVKCRGRKDPSKTGFKIEKIGKGKYYGIRLKEDPYFLLDDGTVVHNCGKVDKLKQLWSYSVDCLMDGHIRKGCPVLFGTAGDISAEGKDFKEMWYNSEIYKLNQFFLGGWMGILVDEYGNDLKEEAIRWIVYERKRREGLSNKEYTDFLQQYPLTVGEAFSSNTDQGLGNLVKINTQIRKLDENPVICKKGYFGQDTTGLVRFIPDARGACKIYEEPEPGVENLYVAGCDPTDHEVEDVKDVSSLSMYIMKRQKGTAKPKIVFSYTDRPQVPSDYYEQAILALKYYNNCRVLIERNRPGMINYFEQVGAKHMLITEPTAYKTVFQGTWVSRVGIHMSKTTKKTLEDCVEEYIEDDCELIPDRDLLEECKNYGVSNTDRVMGWGICLMALTNDQTKLRQIAEKRPHIPSWSYKRLPNGQVIRTMN